MKSNSLKLIEDVVSNFAKLSSIEISGSLTPKEFIRLFIIW